MPSSKPPSPANPDAKDETKLLLTKLVQPAEPAGTDASSSRAKIAWQEHEEVALLRQELKALRQKMEAGIC